MVSLPDGYELLEQYRIESTLGKGGFGITYKAYDKPFDRHVALKEFFPSEFATRREDLSIGPRTPADAEMFDFYRTTFRGEGQALAKFNHPNIVHVHQILDALGTTYLALEHVDGIELETWLRSYNGRPSQRQIDEFLVPLLSALAIIHDAQYLHRDISPRNIMLTRAGLAPKLLDFGAARSITSTSTTAVGLVSNLYSAPEMYSDNPSTQGPWTDIYSVAATVYFAITGSPPPQAPSRMLEDTYVSAAKRVERVEFRANFLRAIDWGLTVRPGERPQSIREWQKLLLPSQDPLSRQARRNPAARKIFISYRRADTEQVAGRIYDRLSSKFGADSIFFDTSAIPAGVDFREHISAAMAESAALVAVIGPNWLAKPVRWSIFKRAAQEEDHVHTEIGLALSEAVPIVPILVGGATMPRPEQLPQAIREVTRINATTIRGGRDFHTDMDRVVELLIPLRA